MFMSKKTVRVLLLFVHVFAFFFIATPALASTLSLSPGGGSISTGGTTYVQVRLNTGGESVNGVSAYLSYPADKVDVVSVSYGGAFPIAAEGSYGGGGIRISRGSISGASGNLVIATVGFRGKAPGASATVSFIGGSAAPRTSDSSDSLSGTSGGTYTIVQGTVPSSTSKKQSTTPQPTTGPADTQAPTITDVTITEISTQSAVITWKTSELSDSTVEYGLDQNIYFLDESDTQFVTDHSIKLSGPLLVPGSLLHARVVSKDKGGNISRGSNITIQLKGYTLAFTIIDSVGRKVRGADVLLYSYPRKGRTNDQGVMTFENVTPGKHLLVVKYQNTEKTYEITVNDTNVLQAHTLVFPSSASVPVVVIGVIILVIAVIVLVLLKLKRKNSMITQTLPQS